MGSAADREAGPAASEPRGGARRRGLTLIEPVTPPFWFAAALVAACVGSVHHACVVLPALYLLPDLDPPHGWVVALGLAALGLGAYVGARRRARGLGRLAWLLLISALLSALGAPSVGLAFSRGWSMFAACATSAVLCAFALGATLSSATSALGRTLVLLGAPWRLASPFRLLFCALGAGGAAGLASLSGPMRAGWELATVLVALAVLTLALGRFLGPRPLGQEKSVLAVALVATFCLAAAAWSSSARPPSKERGYSNPIIFHSEGPRQRFEVTSGQDAFELYVDGRLKASSLDARRYFEGLVQPALGAARSRSRVLLLGGGTGLAEHEILRHADVLGLTVVAVDRTLIDLGRRQRWLSTLAQGALESPRVRFIEQEPVVWTQQTGEQFDVIISDLPDPETPLEGKSYTRWFYRSLAGHLAPGGVLCAQAMSPFTAPESFATVVATLGAAGFGTLSYHSAVPTLGDWGFVLGRVGSAPEPRELERSGPFLSGATLAELTHLPKDFGVPAAGEVNLLHDQTLVGTFRQERGRP